MLKPTKQPVVLKDAVKLFYTDGLGEVVAYAYPCWVDYYPLGGKRAERKVRALALRAHFDGGDVETDNNGHLCLHLDYVGVGR